MVSRRKFGMFIHWVLAPSAPRKLAGIASATGPWDISGIQSPRTIDKVYDNYYKQFNRRNTTPRNGSASPRSRG